MTCGGQSQRGKLPHAMNGLGFAHHLAGAAISAIFADVERPIIFLLDRRGRTRIHAVAILTALFLIDRVHFASFDRLTSEYHDDKKVTRNTHLTRQLRRFQLKWPVMLVSKNIRRAVRRDNEQVVSSTAADPTFRFLEQLGR